MIEYKIKNKIYMHEDMFYAALKMKLTASEWKVLFRLCQKRPWEKTKIKRKTCTIYTNDAFIFPYHEAKAIGIKHTTFFKALQRLIIEFGFLDLFHQGGWYQKHEKIKDYNLYKFSDRWKQWGTPEYIRGDKQKVLQSEFYVRKNMERKLKASSRSRTQHVHVSEHDRPKSVKHRVHTSEHVKEVQAWDKALNPLL